MVGDRVSRYHPLCDPDTPILAPGTPLLAPGTPLWLVHPPKKYCHQTDKHPTSLQTLGICATTKTIASA